MIRRHNLPLIVFGVVAILFGLATIKEGGSVLFVDGASRRAAGHYVPFVVWFNVLAAFGYFAGGVALIRGQRWATRVAMALAGSTALVLFVFAIHIAHGGAWEHRTLAALTLRTAFWTAVALVSRKALSSPTRNEAKEVAA